MRTLEDAVLFEQKLAKRLGFDTAEKERLENIPGAYAKRHETFEFVAFTDAFSIGLDS